MSESVCVCVCRCGLNKVLIDASEFPNHLYCSVTTSDILLFGSSVGLCIELSSFYVRETGDSKEPILPKYLRKIDFIDKIYYQWPFSKD